MNSIPHPSNALDQLFRAASPTSPAASNADAGAELLRFLDDLARIGRQPPAHQAEA